MLRKIGGDKICRRHYSEFLFLKNKAKQKSLTTAFRVTKPSGPIPASCFQTWVCLFSSRPPNQFCKNQAGSLTALISFQTLSLNTRVDLKGLQFPPTFNKTQSVQNTNQVAMNFASKHPAKSSLFILLWLCLVEKTPQQTREMFPPPSSQFLSWRDQEENCRLKPQDSSIRVAFILGGPIREADSWLW